MLREQLIKLAHDVPETRKHLVPMLRQAVEFPTQDAYDKYMKAHPGADPKKHKVVKTEESRTTAEPKSEYQSFRELQDLWKGGFGAPSELGFGSLYSVSHIPHIMKRLKRDFRLEPADVTLLETEVDKHIIKMEAEIKKLPKGKKADPYPRRRKQLAIDWLQKVKALTQELKKPEAKPESKPEVKPEPKPRKPVKLTPKEEIQKAKLIETHAHKLNSGLRLKDPKHYVEFAEFDDYNGALVVQGASHITYKVDQRDMERMSAAEIKKYQADMEALPKDLIAGVTAKLGPDADLYDISHDYDSKNYCQVWLTPKAEAFKSHFRK